mgnify:CR=1 FL=1
MSVTRRLPGSRMSKDPLRGNAGAISGVVGGLAAALLFNRLALQPTGVGLATGLALLLGSAFSVIGQVGDLAESLFKRQVGLKDSSHLIPGHARSPFDRPSSAWRIAACWRRLP